MCRLCGREACAECFDQVRELTEDRPGATQAEIAVLQARREKHSHTNPFFLSCTRRNEHLAKDFSPMSRFCKPELAQAIKEMEDLLAQPDVDALPDAGSIVSTLQDGQVGVREVANRDDNGLAPHPPLNPEAHIARTPLVGTIVPNHTSGMKRDVLTDTGLQNGSIDSQQASAPSGMSNIPSHPMVKISDSELTEEVFRPLWAKGEPIAVTGLLSKFQLQWTPDYFMQKYNSQSCLILECQTDVNKRVTVGEFFSWFGKYEGRVECWKLKASYFYSPECSARR